MQTNFEKTFYDCLLARMGLPEQPDVESAKHVIELAKNTNRYLDEQMKAFYIPQAHKDASKDYESSHKASYVQFSEADSEELSFDILSRHSSQVFLD